MLVLVSTVRKLYVDAIDGLALGEGLEVAMVCFTILDVFNFY